MGHIAGMDTFSATLAFIDGLGAPEMMLIFVLVLVLFGGQKLPEFARGLGKSIREFKKAAAGVEEEFKRALEEDERKHATPALPPPSPDPVTTPTADAATSDQGGPHADPYATTDHDSSVDDVYHGPDHHTTPAEPAVTPPAQPTILPPTPPAPPSPPSSAPTTAPTPAAAATATPPNPPAPVAPSTSSTEKTP